MIKPSALSSDVYNVVSTGIPRPYALSVARVGRYAALTSWIYLIQALFSDTYRGMNAGRPKLPRCLARGFWRGRKDCSAFLNWSRSKSRNDDYWEVGESSGTCQ
jgi:hypothetical protein